MISEGWTAERARVESETGGETITDRSPGFRYQF